MDITRLRTLTLKSKAFFYSDPNWSVEKLINDKSYMVMKAYYELEKVSFTQEVLDILKDKYDNFIEIDKPSKLEGWSDIVFKNNYNSMTYERLKNICIHQHIKYGSVNGFLLNIMQKKKSEMINVESKSRLNISKKDLQSKNHGK